MSPDKAVSSLLAPRTREESGLRLSEPVYSDPPDADEWEALCNQVWDSREDAMQALKGFEAD